MRNLLLIPFLLLSAALPATAHAPWQQRCEPPRRRVVLQPEPSFHACQWQGVRHDHARCEARREVRRPRHRPWGPLVRFGIGF